MIITQAIPNPDYALKIVTDSGRSYIFDVQPYFQYEAFKPLKKISEFLQVSCGGYFIEWACGADLSADTIEAHMRDIAQNITTA